MKKLLIASAALAMVAGTAQAQSSVTVYGIVDAGVVSADGAAAGRYTGISSGVLSTSRLGFRGTEDLGGGLTANFNLETTLNMDTGVTGTTQAAAASGSPTTNTTSTLFDRQAWVGLDKKGVGTLQVGRTTRLDFDAVVAGDAFGASGFGSANGIIFGNVGAVRAPITSSSVNTGDINSSRYNNSVKLATARFGGFQAAYQHAFGESAGANGVSRGTAYALDYTQGKAKATYAYSSQNDNAGAKVTETTVLSGSYDFGAAKLFAGMSQLERAGQAEKTKGNWIGLTAPVNAKIGVMAQYYKVDNIGSTTGAPVVANDADAYALGATYAFSKRTTAYAMYGRVNNDGAAAVSIGSSVAPAGGASQTGYAVGMRHTF
jgi:predicted porin